MKKVSLFILFYFILRLVSSCSNEKKEAMQENDTAIVEKENKKDDDASKDDSRDDSSDSNDSNSNDDTDEDNANDDEDDSNDGDDNQTTPSFHKPTAYSSEAEETLDQQFLVAFRSGSYERIGEFKQGFSQILASNPQSAVSVARMGFLSVWEFSERYRNPTITQDMMQNIGACYQFFSGASQLAPENQVYRGFDADCSILFGQGTNNPEAMADGIEKAMVGIDRLPEFNLFTVGYVMSAADVGTPQFAQALDMMYQNLDVCFSTSIDRENPDVSSLIAGVRPEGDKRFCVNTEIAPYNFEGFFLVFGDLLIKAGEVEIARVIYNNAKLLPSYNNWPYKAVLEDRILNAEMYVIPFGLPVDPLNKPTFPTTMFNSEFSCMGCHRSN